MRRRAGGPYGDGDVASCEWESTAEREVGWDTEVVGNAATSLVRFGAIEKALFFSDITFITLINNWCRAARASFFRQKIAVWLYLIVRSSSHACTRQARHQPQWPDMSRADRRVDITRAVCAAIVG